MISALTPILRHKNRRLLLTVLCLLLLSTLTPSAFAQSEMPEVRTGLNGQTDPTDSLAAAPHTPYTMTGEGFQPEFHMNIPSFEPTAYGMYGYGPYYDDALGSNWQLHKGFNAQFSMSMSCGFGKNRLKGVGFGQTAAFAYVQPVTSRFSIAAGIYANNFDWGPWHTTDVGISGALAYQLTDKLSVYAFGSKSFIPRQNNFNSCGLATPAYWMRPKNRFGAAAEYKFSEHFKMGVSVERVEY